MPRRIYIFLTTLYFLLGLICSANTGFKTPSKNSFAPLSDLCVSAVHLLSAAQGYDITNAYDAEGRRFSKKVNRYQNGQIVEQKHITFLHDGNDLIYERHQLPSGLTLLERKYIWGPDIAGGNAGGAGGLLLIRETIGNVTTDLFPLYDGTGHLIALTDIAGTLRAEFGYGPFGELIYAKGPNASSCPFRYATKYWDEETRLYNFGKRFFDPITGQWLSREPLGESESINLYSYCGNDPVNFVDVRGLAAVAVDGSLTTSSFGINALLGFSTNINAFDADWWGKASETQRQTWEYLVADIQTGKLAQAQREYDQYKAQFTPLAVSAARSSALMTADPDSYLFYRNSLELASAENPLSYLTPARHDGGFIPYLDGAYDAGGEAAVYRAARPMQFLQGVTSTAFDMSPLGAVSTLASASGQFRGGHNLAGAGLIALAVLDAGIPGKVGGASRGAQLRAKYSHYTPSQRQARIQELAMGNRVLREAGIEGKYISEALQSFEPGTITTRIAGANDYGLRFFGGVSGPKSPYLAPTFQGGNIRALSAVPEGNTLRSVIQWRIREGTPLLEGRVRAAFGQPGGGRQIYVPGFWDNLITP